MLLRLRASVTTCITALYSPFFFFAAPIFPDAAARISRWKVGHSE